MKKLSLSTRLLFLPYAFLLIPIYGIGRGISGLVKSGILPQHEAQLALSLLLFSSGIFNPVIGILLDKFKIQWPILFATVLGTVSLLLAPYNLVLGVGVGFGLAVCVLRLATFTGILKTFDAREGYQVSPLAAAKNIGAALFLTFAVSIALTIGWQYMFYALAGLFAIFGAWACYCSKGASFYTYDLKEIRNYIRDKRYWFSVIFVVAVVIFNYGFFINIVPALVESGLSLPTALFLLIASFWAMAFLRFPWAAIGGSIGLIKALALGMTMLLVALAVIHINPILSFILGSIGCASFTQNYTPLFKRFWGKEKIGTSLGFVQFFCCFGGLVAPWIRW